MTGSLAAAPIGTLLAVLASCACAKLRELGRPVCDCCLVHSAAAMPMDGCDCGCTAPEGGTEAHGRLSARILQISAAPSDTSQNAGDCGKSVMTEVTLQLGVFRCITIPPDGEATDCDLGTAEALGFLADEQILRAAVNCCSDTSRIPGRWQITPGLWNPHGPEGGCAGGVLTIQAYGATTFPKLVEA